MRKFETIYKDYIKKRRSLTNECKNFLKEVATAWEEKEFSLSTLENEFEIDNAYICAVYDGGHHPEYASNACSQVFGIFLNKNGEVSLNMEDCNDYGIDRLEDADLDSVAFAVSEGIDFVLGQLIGLIGGTYTIEDYKWTISRETWNRLVDLAEGKDDIRHYLDEEEGEERINALVDCYNPKGYVTLIKKVAEIGDEEVSWKWK